MVEPRGQYGGTPKTVCNGHGSPPLSGVFQFYQIVAIEDLGSRHHRSGVVISKRLYHDTCSLNSLWRLFEQPRQLGDVGSNAPASSDQKLVGPATALPCAFHADIGLLDLERWSSSSPESSCRRGVHTSTKKLEVDIRAFIECHNKNPKPYRWTKSAGEILAAIQTLLSITEYALCSEF